MKQKFYYPTKICQVIGIKTVFKASSDPELGTNTTSQATDTANNEPDGQFMGFVVLY